MKSLSFNFVLALLLTSHLAVAQNDSLRTSKRNTIFTEFAGNAGGYYLFEMFSVNWDHVFRVGKNSRSSFRIGSNIPRFYAEGGGIRCTHNIPIMLNLIWGKRSLNVELGAGLLFHFVNENYSTLYLGGTGILGLRYQAIQSGLFARVAFTPTFALEPGGIFVPLAFGIAAGYSF